MRNADRRCFELSNSCFQPFRPNRTVANGLSEQQSCCSRESVTLRRGRRAWQVSEIVAAVRARATNAAALAKAASDYFRHEPARFGCRAWDSGLALRGVKPDSGARSQLAEATVLNVRTEALASAERLKMSALASVKESSGGCGVFQA